MNSRKVATVALLVLAACDGDALDPTVSEAGLTFFGEVDLVLARTSGPPEPQIVSTLSVRNDGFRPVHETLLGGCFVERMQAFRVVGPHRRLAWDSNRRQAPFGCTADLALVSLAPGERANPRNWGFSAKLSEIRDSLPAGRYAFAVWIRPAEELERIGVGELDLP